MKRILLLIILAIEGIGGLLGGMMLIASPDGRLMDMSVEIMHGTFSNFLIPGLILTSMGMLTSIAFFAVLLKSEIDWLMAGTALIGFILWFLVEILIIREIHWLQIVWGTPVLLGFWAATPLVPHHILRNFEVKLFRTNSIYKKGGE